MHESDRRERKGYQTGRTTGNTTTGAGTFYAGGSYGGSGGIIDAVHYQTNAPYGDYADSE